MCFISAHTSHWERLVAASCEEGRNRAASLMCRWSGFRPMQINMSNAGASIYKHTLRKYLLFVRLFNIFVLPTVLQISYSILILMEECTACSEKYIVHRNSGQRYCKMFPYHEPLGTMKVLVNTSLWWHYLIIWFWDKALCQQLQMKVIIFGV